MEFREYVRNDSHFGSVLHEQIYEMLLAEAHTFEDDTGEEVPEDEIKEIASDMLNSSWNGLQTEEED